MKDAEIQQSSCNDELFLQGDARVHVRNEAGVVRLFMLFSSTEVKPGRTDVFSVEM